MSPAIISPVSTSCLPSIATAAMTVYIRSMMTLAASILINCADSSVSGATGCFNNREDGFFIFMVYLPVRSMLSETLGAVDRLVWHDAIKCIDPYVA
jgi:hypothetical protein